MRRRRVYFNTEQLATFHTRTSNFEATSVFNRLNLRHDGKGHGEWFACLDLVSLLVTVIACRHERSGIYSYLFLVQVDLKDQRCGTRILYTPLQRFWN